MPTAPFYETLVSANQSTRRLNRKEYHQNRNRSENIKFHAVVIEASLVIRGSRVLAYRCVCRNGKRINVSGFSE
jgi:hypothetical protein